MSLLKIFYQTTGKVTVKRIFDILLSILLILALFPLMVIISIVIKSSSKGPVIFFSKRFGKKGKFFKMAKFRTMHINAPLVATHLLTDPNIHVTKIGKFLRKFSLDELPQIYNVLGGTMSFVGPRPALFNQFDLIELRKKKKIDTLMPGITGLAQINGRDSLTISKKVTYENIYKNKMSLLLDIYIIFLTIKKIFLTKNISH